MTRWFKELIVPEEDAIQIPEPTGQPTTVCNSFSDALF